MCEGSSACLHLTHMRPRVGFVALCGLGPAWGRLEAQRF